MLDNVCETAQFIQTQIFFEFSTSEKISHAISYKIGLIGIWVKSQEKVGIITLARVWKLN